MDILTKADIETFTKKLIAMAEQATKLLSSQRGSARAGHAQARSNGVTRRRKRRAGIDPQAVLGALKKSRAGTSVGDLAKHLGAEKLRVAAALKKLRDGRKAKMKGEKRFAKWFAT